MRFRIFHETTMNIDYLQLVGQLSNENYCMIQYPTDSIDDAAAISNQFYTYVGIVTIIAGAGGDLDCGEQDRAADQGADGYFQEDGGAGF